MYPRRLIPGIAIAEPPPAFADGLPRMDVALLAGFAARGPVHRPIRIESVAAYQAVFGGDLLLAEQGGEPLLAALPGAVRAYFSNGGTRAWVIRIARTAEQEQRAGRPASGDGIASARTFTLPVDGAGQGPLQVRAASLGSWADALRISARIDRRAALPRLMLRAQLGAEVRDMGPFSLDPRDPQGWWAQLDDDAAYARPETQPAPRGWLAPGGTKQAFTLAALDDAWTEPVGPDPDSRSALERDGLSRFDASLFLDPALAEASVLRLSEDAGRMRDVDGVQLLGLHGAFAVPGGADFGEPSLIAVPDAVQPGWQLRPDPDLPAPRHDGDFLPPYWRDHRGSCAVPAPRPGARGPDQTRFLDCATRVLTMPVFAHLDPVQRGAEVTLSWSASAAGATYVLEESGRADLHGAEEIWRGTELSHAVQTRREGLYYYRLHAELDGNISPSALTGFVVQHAAWEALAPGHGAARVLLDVQAALLRLCAALGDQFALLALPRHYRSAQAAAHAELLRARFEGAPRPLSFGAIYHPWLVGTAGNGQTVALPPEGALAGTFALRARQRGAWIAPARLPIADVVALSPMLPPGEHAPLAEAGINLIAQDPAGFLATDALTLSRESDWGQINVRRLISLLRRAATRWGAPFVFEPYGETLRRAIERIFGHALDDLVRRGAFAGKGRGDSYRLMVDARGSDRNNGKLVIEIAVAPAQPLRFLTLVLSQAGERFTVAEPR